MDRLKAKIRNIPDFPKPGRAPPARHGERFQKDETIAQAGSVKLNFKVSDGTKSLKQAGIARRVGGKIVDKPGFFGLEDDPEIPPKLEEALWRSRSGWSF